MLLARSLIFYPYLPDLISIGAALQLSLVALLTPALLNVVIISQTALFLK